MDLEVVAEVQVVVEVAQVVVAVAVVDSKVVQAVVLPKKLLLSHIDMLVYS